MDEQEDSVEQQQTYWNVIKNFKSIRYYWYTGEKIVALLSWSISFIISCLIVLVVNGGDIYRSILLVLVGGFLDGLVIPILLLSMYFSIPSLAYEYVFIPLIISSSISILIGRFSAYVIINFKKRRSKN